MATCEVNSVSTRTCERKVDAHISVVVGVLPLPLVEGEGLGGTEELSRVLGTGLSGNAGLVLLGVDLLGGLDLGGSGGGGGLGSSGLLFGGNVDNGLLNEGGGSRGEELGLVGDGVEVTENVGVGSAELGVEDLGPSSQRLERGVQ
jgi:hypothetical protein